MLLWLLLYTYALYTSQLVTQILISGGGVSHRPTKPDAEPDLSARPEQVYSEYVLRITTCNQLLCTEISELAKTRGD